ncbi:MAG: histidine phosphatase family protein [Candidatus Bruticola sp.]
MLEIWLVRHGSTDWNTVKRWQGHSDVPLNELGKNQARALANNLKNVDFMQVWSSDLHRCIETAQLSMPHLKLEEIRLDKRLREIPMGIVEGHTWDELSAEDQAKVTAWWKDPYKTCFPGSDETLQDVSNRAESWIHDLPEDGRVIAFSHGGIIRTILWNIVGPPQGKYQWTMELGNTGVVRLRYTNGFPSLVSFNDMSHIKDAWKMAPAQNVPGSP